MARKTELSSLHQSAKDLLDETWVLVMAIPDIGKARDATWGPIFADVFANGGSTYPYVLLTQILGKATDGSLNALCLQDSSTLEAAWDARSLASKVVVPWNESVGKALPGANNDPYVNNPARYKNFGAEMESKAKDKARYAELAKVAGHVQREGQAEAKRLLELALREIRYSLETNKRDYFGPPRASLDDVLRVFGEFLAERSNGVRLQVVCYAVFKAISEAFPNFGAVRSYSTNSADAAGGRAGDVERLTDSGEVDFAVEVKDRTLTLADVEATIMKARVVDVRNLLFLVQAKPLVDDPKAVAERIAHEFSRGIDVNISQAMAFFHGALLLLSPEQRAGLLRTVHNALHELGAHFKHVKCWMDLMKSI